MKNMLIFSLLLLSAFKPAPEPTAWIRINQLGYTPGGIKVAVWCTKDSVAVRSFILKDAVSGKTVFTGKASPGFGKYGPFAQTCRLNFSGWHKPGRYYLEAGGAKSPEFTIGTDVYNGTADSCLRYMRQQRSGFNPFLKDSCHTHDGYAMYAAKAGVPDSTHLDVVGGWHDASDYLQYSTTSANATYHLLAAYRDFPGVFGDTKQANGLDGNNGLPDIVDEANWGIQWMLKMFPDAQHMYNQVGDDRDHMGMRIPKEDNFYGRGFERPVYFVSGEIQQRGKFMNNTTGTSSTAGKFASVFALAEYLNQTNPVFKKGGPRSSYYDKAFEAYQYGLKKPGVTQTASVKSPYIYAEDNWTDDMELAAAMLHQMIINAKDGGDNGYYMLQAYKYAQQEPITPWLGADTAKHYQWYPFINLGHYPLAQQLKDTAHGPHKGYFSSFIESVPSKSDTIRAYYREGIERVWKKASANAFYRGVPFIWCSNNLTTSFAIQCYWYRQLTQDKSFQELEQANFDWLFGCNPWGTSMVYGLPASGDTPVDPHSAFTHIGKYPIDGGLVDGPVYTSIYSGLIGIQLTHEDQYAPFQSDLAVYHDDYGDYSTNEPTMDGTASLIYLLAAKEAESGGAKNNFIKSHGAIIRGDSTQKNIALVFTAHDFDDGGNYIATALKSEKVKASFFLTGDFYTAAKHQALIKKLNGDGHFLGSHSNHHLLYCDWDKRDSLLVTKQEFEQDLEASFQAIEKRVSDSKKSYRHFFLPPYEWFNDSITAWAAEKGIQLVNFTPGTLSNADYTTPSMKNYRNSDVIEQSIRQYELARPGGLNGFLLLIHLGTDAERTDKFYRRLPALIRYLKSKGYHFQRVDELLKQG